MPKSLNFVLIDIDIVQKKSYFNSVLRGLKLTSFCYSSSRRTFLSILPTPDLGSSSLNSH